MKFKAFVGVFLFSVVSLNSYGADDECSSSLKKIRKGEIDLDWVERKQGEKLSRTQELLNDAVQQGTLYSITRNHKQLRDHNSEYTDVLPRSYVTNQKQSGRCWIFAGTNMLKNVLYAKNLVSEKFDFSQAYLHFFSQLERANNHLEEVIKQGGKKIADKNIKEKIKPSIGDGGFFSDFVFLVQKYGIVPKNAMPDSKNAEWTTLLRREVNDYLLKMSHKMWVRIEEMKGNPSHIDRFIEKRMTGKLPKKSKRKLREQEIEELREMKKEMLDGVWQILVTHLGVPPTEFKFRTVPKDGESYNQDAISKGELVRFTPREWATDYLQFSGDDYVVVTNLVNRPRDEVFISDGAVGQTDTTHPVKYLNLNAARLMDLTKGSIDVGIPVYIGADFGAPMDHNSGIMHPALKDLEGVYPLEDGQVPPKLTKEELMYYWKTYASHAVGINGYDQPANKDLPVKFRVENSWGRDYGEKGYYHMYREWFEDFVYFIVVPKDLLSPEERNIWERKPKKIPDTEPYF